MIYLRSLVLVLLVSGALLPANAAAHPADEYFQLHQLRLTPTGIDMEFYLFPGPLVARQIWQDADLDGDERVSEPEARSFAAALLPKLRLSLERQQELTWTLSAAEFPATFQPLQIGDEGIWLRLGARWPTGTRGKHWLELSNDNYVNKSRFWFDLSVAEGVTLGQNRSERNRLVSEFTVAEPAPGAGAEVVPPAPAGAADASRQARASRSPWLQQLDSLVRVPALTPRFFAIALLVSFALGALHALTPGHGKTVVAAYLVGSRGTVGHAAFLGGVVTLTHTGSVLLLGLLALVASRAVIPSRLTPLLELTSGGLIVALGLNLLWARLRSRRHDRPGHDHTHHDHEHDHSHHHHIPDPSEITWRSLLALGVSGGLVPCPDAIAILLIAVAIQRILLGLLLILAFSAGLAAVLIAIGVALVVSKGLIARRLDRFEPAAAWLPIASAVIVTGLGLAVAIRAATTL